MKKILLILVTVLTLVGCNTATSSKAGTESTIEEVETIHVSSAVYSWITKYRDKETGCVIYVAGKNGDGVVGIATEKYDIAR